MKESELYAPVRAWLAIHYPDHKIHVEKFDADVIAVNGEHVVVVELKTCLSRELYIQCLNRMEWANEVWCCVASEPQNVREFEILGFGVLKLVSGKVRKVRTAKPQPWRWHKMRKHRLNRLSTESPAQDHEVAGLPACRQLREQRLKIDTAHVLE